MENIKTYFRLFLIVGGIPTPTFFMVDIAQFVEYRFMVPTVVGSIPIIHSKKVLYPSGSRGRSAKALFVSSNLTETSIKNYCVLIFKKADSLVG